MAPLDSGFFSGSPDISGTVLGNVEIINWEKSVDAVLRTFGYSDSSATACFVLSLSPDNQRIE